MRPLLIIFSLLVLSLCAPAQAQDHDTDLRVIDAKIRIYEWLPPGFGEGGRKWPLIIFSHGYTGCGTQSKFLTAGLAAHGYVVVAPNHADARCGRRDHAAAEDDLFSDDAEAAVTQEPGSRDAPRPKFRNGPAWTEDGEKNRRDDMLYTLDFILADKNLGPFIDTDRIGLAGHSLGGYTALALAGAWPSWKDKRFKAVLALSPYAAPFTDQKTLHNIDVPVMYQGGTRDFGITPGVKKPGGSYDQTPSPKYFVEFRRTGHLGFTDLLGPEHDAMNDYAFAFFDKYLLGRDSGFLTAKPEAGVTDYQASP